ncbi:hypothetical protein [Thermomonospora umbrina]|uniref:Uncharacterized protein n=1 Tax=Thermomonospora umbrina TaxID=111806 RepID=A0A3D9SVB9_9ACTN|nr:hypothetical protein [Thermomonospora umbrina]REE95611.1 hypothetical protein DFJ69_1010 [Thermomonospora umbrina]
MPDPNHSGSPPADGGSVTTERWNTAAESGGRYFDVSCAFPRRTWFSAGFYNATGTRNGYRGSPQSLFICN